MGYLARIAHSSGDPFDRLWAILTPVADSTGTFSTDRLLEAATYQDPCDSQFLFALTSYAAESDNGYAYVEAEALTTTLRMAAAAALLGKHWPPSCDRPAYIIAAILYQAGWPAAKVIQLNHAIYQFRLPDFDDLDSVQCEVMTAFSNHQNHPRALLTEAVGEDVANQALEWLNESAAPKPEPAVLPASTPLVIPDSWAIYSFCRFYEDALATCQGARLALFALPDKRTFASRNTDLLVDKALSWAKKGLNVYLHIHGHTLPEGESYGRGRLDTACVAIGLFSDIDAVGPGRKKALETLCPTMNDAITLTEEFNTRFAPLRISVLIASGHGCYPLVLFKEPLVIATDDDRALLDSLGRRFHDALHRIACDHGWCGAVDGCDLAKVLRPPGMINYKDPADPQLVRLLYQRDARLTLIELDELLPPPLETLRQTPATRKTRKPLTAEDRAPAWVTGDGLTLDPNANPPAEKFHSLAQQEPEFAWTWNHKRQLRDTSQSDFDLALAHRAAQAGWTDQEIADLLIANRRLHGGQPKLRLDYYHRTIAKGRASAEAAAPQEPELEADHDHSDLHGQQQSGLRADDVQESPMEVEMDYSKADQGHPDQDVDHDQQGDPQADVDQPPRQVETHTSTDSAGGTDPQGTATTPDSPASDSQTDSSAEGTHCTGGWASATMNPLLDMLSLKLKFRILRLRRLNSEPAQYRLLAEQSGERREVKLADVTALISQSRFRNRIADAVSHYTPRFEKEAWDDIGAMLLKACEPEDLGEEATDRGRMEAWVVGYLADQHIHPTLEQSLGDRGQSDSSHEPFRDVDGAVYLRAEGLQEWLRVRRSEKVNLRILTAMLTDCAFVRRKFNVVVDNKVTSRMAWKVPTKLC
jgi:hypothetical protein